VSLARFTGTILFESTSHAGPITSALSTYPVSKGCIYAKARKCDLGERINPVPGIEGSQSYNPNGLSVAYLRQGRGQPLGEEPDVAFRAIVLDVCCPKSPIS
jgi:hypothetical protein